MITAQSLQTYNGQSGRGLKEHTYNVIAEASESDNKEADHSLVNCVGLFKADGGKDHY